MRNRFPKNFLNIFRRNIKTFLNITNLLPLFQHLLMFFTNVLQTEFIMISCAILTNIPICNSRNSIEPYIKNPGLSDSSADLYHRVLLGSVYVVSTAYSHYYMLGFYLRHEIKLLTQLSIHIFV